MLANSPLSSTRPLSQDSSQIDSKESTRETQVLLDESTEGWMTVAGVWLVQFCTYGYTSAFGVYEDFYTRNFLQSTSPSTISWIGSVQLFLQYAPGVIIGKAFDAGYFYHMTIAGAFLQILSMFLLSLVRKDQFYQVFLAQALGSGLGQSLLFLPSITVIGHHFKKRRALATGIAVSGAPIGGIIWPIALNHFFAQDSFAIGIRVTAAISAFLLIIAIMIMRTAPIICGRPTSRTVLSAIFWDCPYWLSILAAFLTSLGLFFPYFYLQLYSISQSIDKSRSFYILSIINAGSFFGRILPNLWADAVGPYNLLIPCLFISSILIFGISGVHTFASVSSLGFLYGFFSGSYVSLIPTLLARLSPHAAEQGTRMGLAFSTVGLALLVGTPATGALVKAKHGLYTWYAAISFSGVMVLCGSLAMILSRSLFIRHGRDGGRGFRV